MAENFMRIYLNIDDNVDLYEVYIRDKEDKLNRLKRYLFYTRCCMKRYSRERNDPKEPHDSAYDYISESCSLNFP